MNKLIAIACIALAALASCSKEKESFDPQQKITYQVECDYCLVYIEDNVWNRNNKLDRSKNQHFNVDGNWRYEWVNTELDSIEMKIIVGVLGGKQNVKASIRTNDGKSVSFDEVMGYNDNPMKEDYGFEKVLKLKLK
ncbi:hypothetical protein [Albibacterium profundi]|uniref:Lipoprotein n=1 Tax=Albibacterium profundi TaxID=3134906 RepID=A0ABV5CF39_9SPHI